MKRVSILAAGVLSAAIIPRDGWALGLGELTLHSYLNEPFRAEVALLESDAFDDSDVLVGLASEVEFERLGVSRDFFLTRINFQVESDELGRRVVLTTDAPLREPYLDLVVEARWPDGRLLREYTVLIDLPPRPMVAEGQDAPVEKAAQLANQAIVSEAGRTDAQTGGYGTDVAMRPTAGAQYLVTSTDTLWRIASEGAAPGISVQQTMLEIVAANPAAFEAGNINGLKSGYVLQIPDYDDIQVDPEVALSEVALQNEEWGRGIPRESRGLTLVADSDSESAEAPVAPSGGPDADLDPALLVESDTESASPAPLDASGASNAEDLQALIMTVSRLQESVDSLEVKLAERDAELVSLRSALTEQQAAKPVPVVMEAPAAPGPQPIPLWPFLAGLATLLVGTGLLIWRRLRPDTESEPVGRGDLEDASPNADTDEASNPSRLSDPQIKASKAVEEAQTYIAYGRTDQAVEVLSDALAEGLTSDALNMCLLECYVELEQFAEADELLERLEQGDDPELFERARRMRQDADNMPPALSSRGLVVGHTEERVEPSQEASVLSELSFSTEPNFAQTKSLVSEKPIEPSQPASLIDDEQELPMAMRESVDDDPATESAAGSVMPGDGTAAGEPSPDTSGLALTPLDHETDVAETPVAEGSDMDESIYGVETNPVDSKLDLARAYLDMGDEDGARPVLMEVIKEGDLTQQAEARELFLRLEAP